MDVSSLSQTVTDLDSQTVLLSQPVMHPNNIGIERLLNLIYVLASNHCHNYGVA